LLYIEYLDVKINSWEEQMASETNERAKVVVFAGSRRNDSLNRKLAAGAARALSQSGLGVTLIELGDFPMPVYDGDLEAEGGLPERAKAFKEVLRSHDAVLIASPEHNGSFPALLKNALDWASRAEAGERPLDVFRGKPAVLVSASPGPGGGRRGLKQLRELLQMMGMTVLEPQLVVPAAGEAFDNGGHLLSRQHGEALEGLGAALRNALPQSAAA
jgi:NAD(P)H-dependent FMN reductase